MSRYDDHVFSIYHLMEKAGMFAGNPANRDSIGANRESLYKGPVEYPKMLYHPKGETRVTEPGQVVRDEFDKPQRVGRQVELVNKIVASAEEEAVLKHLGWLDHPAKSIHAGGGEAPPVSSVEQVKSLEQQVKDLLRQLEEAKTNVADPVPLTDSQKADNALQGARTVKAA